MSRKYFGTDGIRGPYGGPVVNEEFAARLGFAAARWLAAKAGPGARRVLIGRDPRFSGVALEAAIARGLHAGGAEPVSLGVLPTPAVSRAVRRQVAALGVVITASHNPAEDNGIKFFGSAGVKLTDDQELEIENHLPPGEVGAPVAFSAADGLRDYLTAMEAVLPARALREWRIVLDTANGATCVTSPHVLRSLGAELVGIGNEPDGRNINASVGSEHPDKLAALVLTQKARLGIAHDGDGDRCVLCDEQGAILDGDEILAILALHALARGTLIANTLVVTVQSNLGLDAVVGAAGGRVLRTSVGDRYVVERMLAEGATLGGESSGHIICSELSPTGDGLVAALKVIEVMAGSGKPLSELRRALRKFPQATAALKVRERRPLESLTALTAAIADLEREFGSQGRVLVRWSGTEPKLRLLVEGPTTTAVDAGLEKLKTAARAGLNVV
ncbi:MAG TPA: phosphoglucosamine mutase [Opitutaceae bacterium]|nr:phosphoglucosamine mutase [Opitutaceae bacterium]